VGEGRTRVREKETETGRRGKRNSIPHLYPQAGTICLKYLPYGGLYIAGGIAPVHEEKIVDPSKSDFLAAFHDKGRVSKVLDNVKVTLVKADDLGLRGAHFVADSLARRGGGRGEEGEGRRVEGGERKSSCCSQPAVPCIKTKAMKIVEVPSSSSLVPPSPLDNAFYFCGVASVSLLAGLGLMSLYKMVSEK
jgi:hypothetical protein